MCEEAIIMKPKKFKTEEEAWRFLAKEWGKKGETDFSYRGLCMSAVTLRIAGHISLVKSRTMRVRIEDYGIKNRAPG